MTKETFVGKIPVFSLRERTPTELRAHPGDDLFMAYGSDGIPHVCAWAAEAFWVQAENGPEIMMDVEFWFRLPLIDEIIEHKENAF